MNGSTSKIKKSKDILKQWKWEHNNPKSVGHSKIVLRGKLIALQAYLKKQGKAQINNLTLHRNELEKEQTTKPHEYNEGNNKDQSRNKWNRV